MVPTCSFEEARRVVIERVIEARTPPAVESAGLDTAAGRVSAEPARADRDYPPVTRSIRDGFAIRSTDLPGELQVIGEVRAGESWPGTVGPGQTVEIMTGAAVPSGADAVIMIEHTTREGDRVRIDRQAKPGLFLNPKGSEAKAGETLIPPGKRLDFSDVALLATVGITEVAVYRQPRIALLATGDEIVEPHERPRDFEIRNSNVYSLAAQVRRAGGVPLILPVARDQRDDTLAKIARGLESDLLLLSGGVSAGKYDLVETALAELGAEFFFDRVLIQPGQPLVFGRARGKFFFGLPGNPASTMVTFEIFARAAVELLAGQTQTALPIMLATLNTDFRHQTGLTRFLPACLSDANLSADGPRVSPLPWQGSSDVPALSRANAFLVADAGRAEWKSGDLIRVLLK